MIRKSRAFNLEHLGGLSDAAAGHVVAATLPDASIEAIVQAAPSALTPSRFQPRGRPSQAAQDAVREAILRAGSPTALAGWVGNDEDGEQDARPFRTLQGEARVLALLVADIAQHGVQRPLETVDLPDGARELVTGHRRLAAAKLAGRDTVPVQHLGARSYADAAQLVLRDNLHRADFTPWQQAQIAAETERRLSEASGRPVPVRALAAAIGFSLGRTSEMLRLARRFDPAVLASLGPEAEEQLARLSYVQARKLAAAATDADAHDLAAGWLKPAPDRQPADAAFNIEHRRGGGFVATLRKPIERLTPDELADVERQLAAIVAQLRRSIRRG